MVKRWTYVLLLLGVLGSLLISVNAATFNCAIRTSCNSNETLLITLNASESGAAPNNSHAQLANYSGGIYPYAVCCWTDSFRTMSNSCVGNGVPVVSLYSTSNSHVGYWPAGYSAWGYRKTIVIDQSQVNGSLSDFPVLVRISSDSDLASHALASANDILFLFHTGIKFIPDRVAKP